MSTRPTRSSGSLPYRGPTEGVNTAGRGKETQLRLGPRQSAGSQLRPSPLP